MRTWRLIGVASLGTLMAAVVAGPLLAQAPAAPAVGVDLAGEWSARQHEDQPHRAPGPELGDYTGLPISAASRQKAEAGTPPRFRCPSGMRSRIRSSTPTAAAADRLSARDLSSPSPDSSLATRSTGGSGAPIGASGSTAAIIRPTTPSTPGMGTRRASGTAIRPRRDDDPHEVRRHPAQRCAGQSLRHDEGIRLPAQAIPDVAEILDDPILSRRADSSARTTGCGTRSRTSR